MPLIHVPGNPLVSLQLQSLLLVVLGLIVLAYKPYLDSLIHNIKACNLISRVCLTVFLLGAIASSLLAHNHLLPQTLLGGIPEYFGLAQWLSCIVLGFFIRSRLNHISSSFSITVIVSLIVLISIFAERNLITSDFQLSGLLFQATSLAMYACFGLAFLIGNFSTHFKNNPLLTSLIFIILTGGVILAQSRIGLFSYALICAVSVINRPNRSKTVLLGIGVAFMLALSIASPQLTTRYRNEDVKQGLQYRRMIYATSTRELVEKHRILGNGAGVHPVYLNQQKEVPADIAKDLNIGLRFASAHDLLLDIGLMFGVLPLLIALIAIVCSIYHYSKNMSRSSNISLRLAFFVLLLVSFINVPSLVLTPLFIIFLISGLSERTYN